MKLLMISLVTVLLSAPIFAGDFYVLELGDQLLRGQNEIGLKKLMLEQHPGVGDRDSELMSVVLVAKTFNGQGHVKLQVGQNMTEAQAVLGAGQNFKSIDDATYDRILFKSPVGDKTGRWVLHTWGAFNLRQAVVEIGVKGTDLALDYADLLVQTRLGDDDTLQLRQKARNDHGFVTQDYKLVGVTVVAKSRGGRGTVQLVVGESEATPLKVAGAPEKFDSKNIGTYETIEIENPSTNSDGRWNLKLAGDLKIREVVLHMVKK